MVEIYTFTKEECGVDFDTEVCLRINKNLFINVPEEDKYNFGKELDLMFDTLAELTDAACGRKEENATVYKFPLCLSSEYLSSERYDPFSKLFEMCEKVGEGYAVYVGYKRYTFRGNIYYCPQLRLANVCDERGELTMYNIMSFKMEKGKPHIEQMRNENVNETRLERSGYMSNPKTKKLQITIPTKTVEELEKFAEERQLTKSVIIQLAIEQYIEAEKAKETKNMKKKGDKNEAKEVFLQRS